MHGKNSTQNSTKNTKAPKDVFKNNYFGIK